MEDTEWDSPPTAELVDPGRYKAQPGDYRFAYLTKDGVWHMLASTCVDDPTDPRASGMLVFRDQTTNPVLVVNKDAWVSLERLGKVE